MWAKPPLYKFLPLVEPVSLMAAGLVPSAVLMQEAPKGRCPIGLPIMPFCKVDMRKRGGAKCQSIIVQSRLSAALVGVQP